MRSSHSASLLFRPDTRPLNIWNSRTGHRTTATIPETGTGSLAFFLSGIAAHDASIVQRTSLTEIIIDGFLKIGHLMYGSLEQGFSCFGSMFSRTHMRRTMDSSYWCVQGRSFFVFRAHGCVIGGTGGHLSNLGKKHVSWATRSACKTSPIRSNLCSKRSLEANRLRTQNLLRCQIIMLTTGPDLFKRPVLVLFQLEA